MGSITVQTPSRLEYGGDRTDEVSELVDVVDHIDPEDDPSAVVESGRPDIDALESDVPRAVNCGRVRHHVRVDVDAQESSTGMRARNGCEYVSRPAADLEHEIAGLDPLRNVLSDHVNPLSLQMSLSLTFVFSGCDLEVRVHRSLGEMKDEDAGGLDDNRTAEAPLQVRCARRIHNGVSHAQRSGETTTVGATVENRRRAG